MNEKLLLRVTFIFMRRKKGRIVVDIGFFPEHPK
jgi:hypothetical protein